MVPARLKAWPRDVDFTNNPRCPRVVSTMVELKSFRYTPEVTHMAHVMRSIANHKQQKIVDDWLAKDGA